MNPPDFPWWVWMGCAPALVLLSLIFFCLSEHPALADDSWIFKLLFWVTLATGGFAAIIGIIRFVKWVWVG
jgi:hypothetical protein